MSNKKLTHEEILFMMEYIPSGNLIWRVHPVGSSVDAGDIVGSTTSTPTGLQRRVKYKGVTYRLIQLIYFYHVGEWATTRLRTINTDPIDLRIENIVRVGEHHPVLGEQKKLDWNDREFYLSRYFYDIESGDILTRHKSVKHEIGESIVIHSKETNTKTISPSIGSATRTMSLAVVNCLIGHNVLVDHTDITFLDGDKDNYRIENLSTIKHGSMSHAQVKEVLSHHQSPLNKIRTKGIKRLPGRDKMPVKDIMKMFYINSGESDVRYKKPQPPRSKRVQDGAVNCNHKAVGGQRVQCGDKIAGYTPRLKDIAWVLHHRKHPTAQVLFYNKNPCDFSKDNLYLYDKGKKKEMTAELARSLFRYNEATGRLHWDHYIKYNDARKGELAGSTTVYGYRIVKFQGQIYKQHRLVWAMHFGKMPPEGMVIDHLNGNRSDNRLTNLRLANHSENAKNVEGSKVRNERMFSDTDITDKDGPIWAQLMSGVMVLEDDGYYWTHDYMHSEEIELTDLEEKDLTERLYYLNSYLSKN